MASIALLGVPLDLGASRRGVEMGPSAVRLARLASRLEQLGHTVVDTGDVPVPTRETLKLEHGIEFLPTITDVCRDVAHRPPAWCATGRFRWCSVVIIPWQADQSPASRPRSPNVAIASD